jgi:hypothetical protein
VGTPAPQNQNNIAPEDTVKAASTGQVDTVESASEATSEVTAPTLDEETSKDAPLSKQYALLAKKEKAIRQKASDMERTLKTREAALAAREAELAKTPSVDTSKYISIDDLKSNTFATLQKLGVSYDQISEEAIAAQSPEAQALQRMRQEIQGELQTLREEQEKTRQSIENNQTQAYQQAVKQITLEATNLINNDPNFETVKEAGAVKDVVELIERTYAEENRLMTVDEAAQAVEDYLMEEAIKLSRIKKVQERLKPAAAPANQAKQPQQIKTLTNSIGVQKPLSARERALLAFKGESIK